MCQKKKKYLYFTKINVFFLLLFGFDRHVKIFYFFPYAEAYRYQDAN